MASVDRAVELRWYSWRLPAREESVKYLLLIWGEDAAHKAMEVAAKNPAARYSAIEVWPLLSA